MKFFKHQLAIIIAFLLIGPSCFGQWVEQDKMVPSDRSPGDYFGASFGGDIYGDIAVVGGPRSDQGNGTDQGAAYVFERNTMTCEWEEVQILTASDMSDDDGFGMSVSIFGKYIAVGAPYEGHDENNANFMLWSGSVYIFERSTSGTWVEIHKIVAQDREPHATFGQDVDIYEDRVIVGARWETQGPGAPYAYQSGAAYVFQFSSTAWTEEGKLLPSDRDEKDLFGTSVTIANNQAVVGAMRDEHDANGANAITAAGSAYVYERIGNTWIEVAKLTPSSADRQNYDQFGDQVDMIEGLVVINSPTDDVDESFANPLNSAGSAYVFRRNTIGSWILEDKMVASNRASGDHFGRGVTIYEETIVVGASYKNGYRGSGYVFEYDGVNSWDETQVFLSSDNDQGDYFAGAVSLYENKVICIASREEEDDAPIPGNTMVNAGSAYIFHIPTPADQPTLAASSQTFCAGETVQLSVISGNLNDNYTWDWYSPVNGGTLVGSGTTITVNPTGTITYYVIGTGGCAPDGPYASITLTEDPAGNWNQTSKNASGGDANNDVITDDMGNVFVTGSFIETTTLNGAGNPDITMNSNVPNATASYIAKYNGCGNLLWAAHSVYPKKDVANAIVLNENTGIAYITGDFSGNLNFNSSNICGAPGASIITNQIHKGYVAAFDMNTGCLLSLDLIDLNNYTQCQAIAINENNGDLFVGGSYSNNLQGSYYTSYIRRYAPTNNGIGAPTADVNSTSGTNNNRIMDMDYDENYGFLWSVGTFRSNVEFQPGTAPIIANAGANQDAFLLVYLNSVGLVPLGNLRGNASQNMTGEGIAIDETNGSGYLTGTYYGSVPTPFQYTALNTLPTNTSYSSYMIKYGIGAVSGPSWARYANATAGRVVGKGVAVKNSKSYFTGDFRADDLIVPNLGIAPYVTSTNFGFQSHVYVICYASDGTPIFGNVTTDPTSTIGRHEASAIAVTDQEDAFTVGRYRNNLDYLYTAYSSPPLNSTGVGNNAFVLRLNGPSMSFLVVNDDNYIVAKNETGRRSERQSSENVDSQEEPFTVWPNPTSGQLTVRVPDMQAQDMGMVQVFDALGQLVMSKEISSQETKLSLENQQNGIYFINYIHHGNVQSMRIIKSW